MNTLGRRKRNLHSTVVLLKAIKDEIMIEYNKIFTFYCSSIKSYFFLPVFAG